MKGIFVTLLSLIFAISCFSQKSAVTSAWSYYNDGFLDDAKKAIDKAELNPQTSESYKTFWFKGKIYQDLGSTKVKKYQTLCTDCYETAYDAYMKALKFNFVNPEHRNIDFSTQEGLLKFAAILNENNESYFESTEAMMDILFQRFPALSNAFVNKGIAKFQEQKFEESYAQFESAIKISTLTFRVDTQLYYYASLSALRSKKYEEAVSMGDFLIKANYGADEKEKVVVYQNQAYAYKELGKVDKMLEVLQKGIDKFPSSNYPLVIETFNYYVSTKDNDKALEYINMAIEKNPEDAQFYVIRGTLLQETNKAKAMVDFEKALTLSSENYDANYALGALYINTASDTIKWAEENIPISQFSEMNKYQEIAKEYQVKALPYLEKALTLKNNDLEVLRTLKELYYRLARMEDYNRIKTQLDALVE